MFSNPLKISTIVLNWNNAPDTLACLTSLTTIQDPHHHIIVVDNGSTDGSYEVIRKAFPHLDYLQNGSNLGFAEGNNRGITYALKQGADAILLLNNDTVVDPGLLQAFREASKENPQAGVFGAKIYFYDEPTMLWHAGGNVNVRSGKCYHLGFRACDLDKGWEKSQEINYACGCALFIKADVIRKVGLMDPDFFLIWEEVDWCWRIRKAGFSCLFVPKAKVWHKISASFDGGGQGWTWHYFYSRNRLLFFKRNYPLSIRLPLFTRIFLREALPHMYLAFSSNAQTRKESRASLAGFRDYLLNRFGSLPT